jgi:hypothetical protein
MLRGEWIGKSWVLMPELLSCPQPEDQQRLMPLNEHSQIFFVVVVEQPPAAIIPDLR